MCKLRVTKQLEITQMICHWKKNSGTKKVLGDISGLGDILTTTMAYDENSVVTYRTSLETPETICLPAVGLLSLGISWQRSIWWQYPVVPQHITHCFKPKRIGFPLMSCFREFLLCTSLDVDKSTSGHYVNAFQMIVILKSLSKLQYRSAFHLILNSASLFLKWTKKSKCFWNDRKKLVISVRMSENKGQWTLLWWVLLQLWDKWPKCFSDQFVSARNDPNVSEKNRYSVIARKEHNSKKLLKAVVSNCESMIVFLWRVLDSLFS